MQAVQELLHFGRDQAVLQLLNATSDRLVGVDHWPAQCWWLGFESPQDMVKYFLTLNLSRR